MGAEVEPDEAFEDSYEGEDEGDGDADEVDTRFVPSANLGEGEETGETEDDEFPAGVPA